MFYISYHKETYDLKKVTLQRVWRYMDSDQFAGKMYAENRFVWTLHSQITQSDFKKKSSMILQIDDSDAKLVPPFMGKRITPI